MDATRNTQVTSLEKLRVQNCAAAGPDGSAPIRFDLPFEEPKAKPYFAFSPPSLSRDRIAFTKPSTLKSFAMKPTM